MTHQIYSATALEALSTKEIKTIASQIGAIPDGDKRSKQVWISAVIDHQTAFSPVKVAAMEAHIETVLTRLESVTPDEEVSTTPIETPTEDIPTIPMEVPTDTIDSYVPTPRTHADDVSFAAAMGLTYDDVFGKPLGGSEWEETTPALEPNTQSLEPSPKSPPMRGASTVALVAVLIFGLAFLVIKTGFTAFAWAIAALAPLALGLWQYLFPEPRVKKSIDYFPSAIV